MNWIILIIAGLFEIGWAIGIKYTEGFTRLRPTIGTILKVDVQYVQAVYFPVLRTDLSFSYDLSNVLD
ncbi:MAG: SMR family transporter [Desulfopila sp.]|jgi:multidrug transporter EmrE-like cation transporter|nr:SMR family transporter [Desulfopila sp.]